MCAEEKMVEGEADFTPAGLFTSTRGITVTGLAPGKNYAFGVRALGCSTGQSDFSDPVSHRSL